MLDSAPSTLLTEWKAFYQLEPFGEWRNDFRMAEICSLLANINRDDKKRTTPYSFTDFMPDFLKTLTPPKPVSLDELKLKMRAVAAAFKDRKPKETEK